MKRIYKIFLVFILVLMLSTNINVNANSGGYSLLVRKGDVTESFSTSEVTSDEKNIFDNKVVFNNNSIKVNGISLDRFSVTDAQGALLGPINFTITGDNTFKVLSISSCSLSVSGTGSLKFVPSAFGEEGIITDVEQQKVFVSSKVKTSLPITYEDGYVYINKKVVETPSEEPSKEPEKETTDSSNEVVNKEESTNKNETTNKEENSNKEEIKDTTGNVNKNENNTVVNDNSDKNNSQSSKPSNDNKNDNNKNDKTDEVINDNVDNNIVTSDDSVVDNTEVEKTEDTTVESDLFDDVENIKEKENNMPLYIGIGTVAVVGTVGSGMVILRKKKIKLSK